MIMGNEWGNSLQTVLGNNERNEAEMAGHGNF